MIDNDFLREIGLNENQVTLLRERLDKESRYRRILGSEHVSHIEDIMRISEVDDIDFTNEELLRLKIRTEYEELIPKTFKKQSQK